MMGDVIDMDSDESALYDELVVAITEHGIDAVRAKIREMGASSPAPVDMAMDIDHTLQPRETPPVECDSCGENMPRGECPASKRPCGHHCDCSWTQDACCWCGKEFGDEEETPAADPWAEFYRANVKREDVPDEHQWIATDAIGHIHLFVVEPKCGDAVWACWICRRVAYRLTIPPGLDWRESKRRVADIWGDAE